MEDQMRQFIKLVENENPDEIQNIWLSAKILDWQYPSKPSIKPQDVINILLRYLNKYLSEQQVEDWANLIEAADVALGSIGNEDIEDIIYELANPAVEGELTPEAAEKMIQKLREKASNA